MPLPKQDAIDAEQVDADFDRIEELMKRLDVEFNMYFQGGRKTPPEEFRRQLDGLVRKYRNRALQRYAHRFRFATLMSQYAVNSERWNRRLKQKEEVVVHQPTLAQKATMEQYGVDLDAVARRAELAASSGAEVEVPQEESRREFKIGDLARDRETVGRLFEQYVAAKKGLGEDVKKLRRETFEKTIAKQLEAFRQKGSAAVQFKVETRDGKVTLKAGKAS